MIAKFLLIIMKMRERTLERMTLNLIIGTGEGPLPLALTRNMTTPIVITLIAMSLTLMKGQCEYILIFFCLF